MNNEELKQYYKDHFDDYVSVKYCGNDNPIMLKDLLNLIKLKLAGELDDE